MEWLTNIKSLLQEVMTDNYRLVILRQGTSSQSNNKFD